jgi:hypothetical protein
MTVARPQMIAQPMIVPRQLKSVASTAKPYPERALPIYVQQLRRPDIREILPVYLKYGGIRQISIRFTPCILPVTRVESMVERAMLEEEKNDRAQEETKLKANIIPAKASSFFTTLRLR